MITFILAAIAIAVIASRLHTTIVYVTLFLCGVIAVPLMPALQLTIVTIAVWILIESAIVTVQRLHEGQFKFLWQVGQFRLAVIT